jgi:hypothetical protein
MQSRSKTTSPLAKLALRLNPAARARASSSLLPAADAQPQALLRASLSYGMVGERRRAGS